MLSKKTSKSLSYLLQMTLLKAHFDVEELRRVSVFEISENMCVVTCAFEGRSSVCAVSDEQASTANLFNNAVVE